MPATALPHPCYFILFLFSLHFWTFTFPNFLTLLWFPACLLHPFPNLFQGFAPAWQPSCTFSDQIFTSMSIATLPSAFSASSPSLAIFPFFYASPFLLSLYTYNILGKHLTPLQFLPEMLTHYYYIIILLYTLRRAYSNPRLSGTFLYESSRTPCIREPWMYKYGIFLYFVYITYNVSIYSVCQISAYIIHICKMKGIISLNAHNNAYVHVNVYQIV